MGHFAAKHVSLRRSVARTFPAIALWIFDVVKRSVHEWSNDKVPRMAAAMAFYAVFSLTPIVVLAVKLGEAAFGTDITLREILTQAAILIGNDAAEAIELLIETARPQPPSMISTVLGLAAMVFAATGVFTELKDSLNTIWDVKPRPGLGLLEMIRYRFFAFAMVLVIWFLMLVSLVASAAMSAVSKYTSSFLGIQVTELLVSLGLITLLFALIYRFLPDASVAWRDVWLGALTTAFLFVIGKSMFGLYLGHSFVGSSYGAAGSVVIVMLWTYYSCLILLFGAEMSQVQAQLRHVKSVPNYGRSDDRT